MVIRCHEAGETYTYTTNTSDPDSDDVYYWFEWGDGTNSGWVGPSTSGDPVSMSHSWSAQGDYTIRVKARDRCFAESDWATLSISMPKSKQYANSLILNFLRNYPNLFQILQRLLNL